MSGRGVSPFDRLIKQQCQKGAAIGASKSAGYVGRFGSTTFTSIRAARAANAAAGGGVAAATGSARPKKFFKSRAGPPAVIPEVEQVCEAIVPQQKQPPPSTSPQKRPAPPPISKKNKFFTSKKPKAAPTRVEETENRFRPEQEEKPKKVPPLKLKIKAPLPPPPPPPPESPPSPPSPSSPPAAATSLVIPKKRLARSDSSSSTASSEDEETTQDEDGSQETVVEDPPPPATFTLKTKVIQESQEDSAPPIPQVQPLRSYGRKRVQAPPPSSNNHDPIRLPAARVQPSVVQTPPSPTPPAEYKEDPEDPEVSFKVDEVDDDAEISFKDDSLVIQSPNAKSRDQSSEDITSLVESRIARKEEETTWRDLPVGTKEKEDESTHIQSCVKTVDVIKRDPYLRQTLSQPAETSVTPVSELKAPSSSTSSSTSSSQPLESTSSLATTSSAAAPSRPKRRAIFKSKKANGTSEAKKGLSLYKHQWNAGPVETEEDFRKEVVARAVFRGLPSTFDSMDFDEETDGRVPPLPGGKLDNPPPTDMSFAASKLVRVASAPAKATGGEGPSPFDMTMEEVVSVKCPKEQKGYYMVIKNVKKAHQIQDSGEFQEFNDDVDYILEGLGAKNGLSTRCLSTITLASKCMEPGFRMHLRAHGTVTQFFAELRDAPQNAALALCASTVLFVLSQERLNMDLDRESLELMLNLLDTDSKIKDALDSSGMNERELLKNKQKVLDLVAAMKKKGHATTLSLEQISADHLAMETLLSLTSKRAGEWFKEELRELGGLDHLVRTFSDCVSFLTSGDLTSWSDKLHDKLRKADRVLKVLENVTHENEENCNYLLKYQEGHFLRTVHNLYRLLDEEVALNPSADVLVDRDAVSHTLRETTFDVIRVYINLVHDYHSVPFGSEMAGKLSGLFDITLHCLFVLPDFMPAEKKFDMLVLALTLLINLVENCVPNRVMLMKATMPDLADTFTAPSDRIPAHAGLIRLFLEKEESAKKEETKTDNILDGVKDEEEEEEKKKEEAKSQEERIEETVAKLLHKAGRHMEDTLIGSYITLIIGYIILHDKERETEVRGFLPDGNFAIMVTVLKKFYNFMNLTASATLASSRGLKATDTIIKYLESIDKPKEDIVKKEAEEESFDDLTVFEVSKDEDGDSSRDFTMDKSGFYPDEDFGKL